MRVFSNLLEGRRKTTDVLMNYGEFARFIGELDLETMGNFVYRSGANYRNFKDTKVEYMIHFLQPFQDIYADRSYSGSPVVRIRHQVYAGKTDERHHFDLKELNGKEIGQHAEIDFVLPKQPASPA